VFYKAKDSGIAANSERQRKRYGKRESRRLAQHSNGIPYILFEIVHAS